MLNINLPSLQGKSFYKDNPNIEYVCIGYGQDPTSAANYVVGTTWDQANNRSKISTHLFKDVTFVGDLSK